MITNDVDTINNALSQNLTSVVTQVTTAIGVLVMMLVISPASVSYTHLDVYKRQGLSEL